MLFSNKNILTTVAITILLALLASCAPPAVRALDTYSFPAAVKPASPINIVPGKFEANNSNEYVLQILNETVLNDLNLSTRFLLTDRDASDALFDQIVDQQLGLLSDETALELGKQLGAKYTVSFLATAEVVDFNPVRALGGNVITDTLNTAIAVAQPNYVSTGVSLSMTDIETGTVIAVGKGEGSRAGGLLSGQPLEESLRDASINALNALLANYIARGYDR